MKHAVLAVNKAGNFPRRAVSLVAVALLALSPAAAFTWEDVRPAPTLLLADVGWNAVK